jgi:hypothetical protein
VVQVSPAVVCKIQVGAGAHTATLVAVHAAVTISPARQEQRRVWICAFRLWICVVMVARSVAQVFEVAVMVPKSLAQVVEVAVMAPREATQAFALALADARLAADAFVTAAKSVAQAEISVAAVASVLPKVAARVISWAWQPVAVALAAIRASVKAALSSAICRVHI